MSNSEKFTFLSLVNDRITQEILRNICLDPNIEHLNALDKIDFLEDCIDNRINLAVFHIQDDENEVLQTIEMLQQDSLSKDMPIIIISNLMSNEELSLKLRKYPVIAIYTYENWKYQISSLIKVLSKQQDLAKALHDNLSSSEEKNFTDPLTGALNRRGCERSFQRLVGYYLSNQESFSLVMIDIDYFKRVNDTYGHETGDEVLVEIASLLKALIRKDDSIIRLGGEEFIVLLSNCDLEVGKKKAEELRNKIELTPLSSKKLSITASFGIVEYCCDAAMDKLIHQADTFLYKAKDAGRNQLCFA